jgi:hypothetical protein
MTFVLEKHAKSINYVYKIEKRREEKEKNWMPQAKSVPKTMQTAALLF